MANIRLEGSDRRAALGARRVGPADPNEKVSVTIRVRRRPGASVPPDHDYWAANPPGKRRFISRQELAAQCGADQADLDKVAVFARSHGLQVVESSAAKRKVVVSGTVRQAGSAFGVDLGRYESPTESYRGREGFVSLPTELADVVEGVFGLDNRRVFSPGFLTTQQVAAFYDFPGWETSPPSASAAGQTIGLLEFGIGGFAQADINQFFAPLPIPTPKPTVIPVLPPDGGSPESNNTPGTLASRNPIDKEVTLDICVAGSAAPGANLAVYFGSNDEQGVLDSLQYVIYDDAAQPCVLSISYGASEDSHTSSFLKQASGFFRELAWLGITVFSVSQDFGSNANVNDGLAHVTYPGSDPWVTCCGGTNITAFPKPPLIENTWNVPAVTLPPPAPPQPPSATGGGVSDVFPVPAWQNSLTATSVKGGTTTTAPLSGRGVPDIAGYAYPGYGIVVYGVTFGIGGSSAVAPLYAGLVALYVATVGERLGFINPMLYAIGNTTGQNALQAINDGLNNELTGGGVTPCPYYVATSALKSGWNACTGLGKADGNKLLLALMPLDERRLIDANQPFPFGAGGEWLNYHNQGATDTGNGVNAGQINSAAPDDSTLITTPCNNNAALAADNVSTGNGVVGVFGRSRGSTWSIGVAGESQTGCGVYGIATGELPSGPNVIGVAGRSMGGIAVEAAPLERIVDQPIGVLGQSTKGPGIRGHGGPLLKQPPTGSLVPALEAAPGGLFSSGRLQDQAISYIFPSGSPQTVSLDSLAQLRLLPSVAAKTVNNVVKATLPVTGNVGDLFLILPPTPAPGFFGAAQLYICTAVVPAPGDVANAAGPRWQLVQLGPLLAGGAII